MSYSGPRNHPDAPIQTRDRFINVTSRISRDIHHWPYQPTQTWITRVGFCTKSHTYRCFLLQKYHRSFYAVCHWQIPCIFPGRYSCNRRLIGVRLWNVNHFAISLSKPSNGRIVRVLDWKEAYLCKWRQNSASPSQTHREFRWGNQTDLLRLQHRFPCLFQVGMILIWGWEYLLWQGALFRFEGRSRLSTVNCHRLGGFLPSPDIRCS